MKIEPITFINWQQHLLLRCSLFIVIMEASKHYTYPRTPHVSGSAVVDDDARWEKVEIFLFVMYFFCSVSTLPRIGWSSTRSWFKKKLTAQTLVFISNRITFLFVRRGADSFFKANINNMSDFATGATKMSRRCGMPSVSNIACLVNGCCVSTEWFTMSYRPTFWRLMLWRRAQASFYRMMQWPNCSTELSNVSLSWHLHGMVTWSNWKKWSRRVDSRHRKHARYFNKVEKQTQKQKI